MIPSGPPADLAAAFAALPIGVLVCTPAGDRANEELRRILRAGGRRTVDRTVLDRALEPLDPRGRAHRGGPRARPRPRPIRSALAGDPLPDQRSALRRMDGTVAVVRIAGRSLRLAEGPGVVVTVIDETAIHEVERLRDAFLAVVGHELRSPISSISAAAELLLGDGLSAEIRAELAQDLGDEAQRLNELVEQLIRLADFRRFGDAVGDEPTHLPHLVRAVVARWRRGQPRLEIVVEVSPDGVPPVAGDATALRQVLDALLDNAVKYGGLPGPVVVRLEPVGREVAVHVLDTGPGVPATGTERLFGLFRRAGGDAAGASSAPAGHGIGLFVARSIVQALGGRVWAANRQGGGADIGFALPAAPD